MGDEKNSGSEYDLNLPREKTYVFEANIWKRIVAFILDFLIINIIIIWPFSRIIYALIPDPNIAMSLSKESLATNQLFFIITTIAVISVFYFALFEYKLSQTPGMMIFRLHKVSTEEKPTNVLQCFASNLFILPIFPFFIFWIIDPLFLVFRNETLSNQLTRTKVVETIKGN